MLNPANIIDHGVAELPTILCKSDQVEACELRIGPRPCRVDYPITSSASEVEDPCWWFIAIIVKRRSVIGSQPS